MQIYKKAFVARMTECLEKKNLELSSSYQRHGEKMRFHPAGSVHENPRYNIPVDKYISISETETT